jgi:L-asparaginase
MKKLLIIHTGGTISMEQSQTGIQISSEHPLTTMRDDFEIPMEEVELFSLPSPHITPLHMVKLANYVQSRLHDSHAIEGIVITHGTDTLEETAYFLELTIKSHIPIVMTGAMRPSNEIGTDALYNFYSAIRVALTKEASHYGVLVVMNDEIHSARYVTKTSTSNVATFKSPPFGPIGLIHHKKVVFYHKNMYSDNKLPIDTISKSVYMFKAFSGMPIEMFESIDTNKVNGVVIEALGQGNLPPTILPILSKLIEKGLVIVIVSRCYNGMVQPVYGYDGGGKSLESIGVIFANQINGPKARLKLLLLLENHSTKKEIIDSFTD